MKNEVWNTVKAMFPITNRKSTPAPAPPPVFPVTEDTSTPVEGWTSLKLRLLMNVRQLVTEDFPIPLPGVEEHVKGYVFTRDEYHEVRIFQINSLYCHQDFVHNEFFNVTLTYDGCPVYSLDYVHVQVHDGSLIYSIDYVHVQVHYGTLMYTIDYVHVQAYDGSPIYSIDYVHVQVYDGSPMYSKKLCTCLGS